jgi:hypothetical protein
VSDMNEFKLAVRAMCRAAQLILPWNMAFNAIDGFLHSSNYGNTELSGRSNRAQILTDFVNYVLGLNAAAWVQKEDFLTSGEVKLIWGEWFGSRPASLLTVAAHDKENSSQNNNTATSGHPNGRGRGRGRGAARYNNQHAQPSGAAATVNFSTPPPTAQHTGQICRRYNYGNCPNTAATCALPSGTKLHHRCDALNAQGNPCNGGHPRINHR